MTAFKKRIGIIVLGIGFFFYFRWHKPDMRVVYPDNCVFFIDRLFSSAIQIEIKQFIDKAYKKNKNPSGLLPAVESKFSQVKSIIIDMQKPEALHFSVQAYQPLFLVNNEHVVCEQDKVFDSRIYSSQGLQPLENILFTPSLSKKNVRYLVQFFQSLTSDMIQHFSIRWVDKNNIWLDQKYGHDLSLLVTHKTALTDDDILQCQGLSANTKVIPVYNKKNKPLKTQTTCVCDLRFDKQIVLFSTNKGV